MDNMIKVNFIPKTDIEEYLNNDFNIKIFKNITDLGRIECPFDPLEFYNLLYEKFEFVKVNKHKPLTVRNNLRNLNLTHDQRYYLMTYLDELIDMEAYFIDDDHEYILDEFEKPKKRDIVLARCLKFIQEDLNIIEDIEFEYYKEREDINNDPFYKYYFKKTKEHIESLADVNMKIQYLIKIKNEYRQDILTSGYYGIKEKNTFDQKCDLEIAKLQEISALEQQTSQPKQKQQFDRFTNSQIVLIFYYFFKLNGLIPRVSIDIAPIAKFIHLITGKDFKTIPNSDFYKKLQTVPNFKSDKELINDLEVIKPLFKIVQLNEIVKMIDNEIEQARTEINQNRKSK